LHREIEFLKSVCWFEVKTQVENIQRSLLNPTYDIFLYHGSNGHTNFHAEPKIKIRLYSSQDELIVEE